MHHHMKASPAGSTERNGKRRLGGLLAILALCALGSSAPAASADPPTATMGTVSAVSYTSAHVTGTVDPANQDTYYAFEYSTDGAVWSGFTYLGPVAANAGPTPVEADLSGLKGGTHYFVRLAATNDYGTFPVSPEPNPEFTTLHVDPPAFVSADAASEVAYTSAKATGKVERPSGNADPAFDVNCRFEYLSDQQFNENVANGGSGFENAASADCAQNPVTTEGSKVDVSANLEGLNVNTTYHLRLHAENAGGVLNADAPSTFTTLNPSAPVVTIDPVTTFDATTAHFSGHVTPGGTDQVFATDWHFQCTPECPGLNGHLEPGTSPEEVPADAKGLEPNTDYQVELIATNQGGQGSAGPVSFKTPLSPPSAITLPAFPLGGGTRALLGGNVNPHNSATEYWIEYGPTATYGTATQHAAAGAGGSAQLVRQEITDLTAGSTYHFRLVAENASGERTDGTDLSFTMPTPAGPEVCANAEYRVGAGATLPDCRAYELASPPDFGGASLWTEQEVTFPSLPETWNAVARDGSAVIWKIIVGGQSDSQGIADAYRSVRGPDGWHSQFAGPPGSAGVPTVPYLQFATPSLDRLLWRTGNVGADPSDHDPVEDSTTIEQYGDLYTVGSDGTLAHVNRGTVEVPVTGESLEFVGASQDLGKVVFSSSRQLTATPGGGTYWTDGQTTKLISTSETGAFGGVGTSADASLVAFVSPLGQDLYIWSEQSDATVKVLEAVIPGSPQGDLSVDSISADGTKVFFRTRAAMTAEDTDTSTDLYQYNTSSHDITLLSAPSGGGPVGNSDDCAAPLTTNNNGPLARCDIAPVTETRDGSLVYFASPEQLVSGQGVDGGMNLYLATNGEIRFVATLDSADPVIDGNYSANYGSGIRSRHVQPSPDGKKLIFESEAALTNYDNAGFKEIYVYDSATGTLACASCRANGTPPTGDSALKTLPNAHPAEGGSEIGYDRKMGTANSDEHGDRIFFNSGDAIVPKDVNDRNDVYEYDVASGTPSLISSGTSERDSGYIGNGFDGRDVFFLTTDTLDPRDKNGGLYKMYDARAGGGLPLPPPAGQPCEGDGCKGASSAAPAGAAPASAVFSGPGNVNRTRCAKNTVRVRRGGKARCVKKHQRKHHGKKKSSKNKKDGRKKDAKHNRRAGR